MLKTVKEKCGGPRSIGSLMFGLYPGSAAAPTISARRTSGTLMTRTLVKRIVVVATIFFENKKNFDKGMG